tara:strand:- start:68 stop:343 length:276 start_codon:yes stop_codon:yes gene_type:complete
LDILLELVTADAVELDEEDEKVGLEFVLGVFVVEPTPFDVRLVLFMSGVSCYGVYVWLSSNEVAPCSRWICLSFVWEKKLFLDFQLKLTRA